jgi:hypothetical protein
VIKRVSLAIAFCLIWGAVASAKVQSRLISVGKDFVVNGTPLKAGTYKFNFDDKRDELTISDPKTNSVVAKAIVKIEKRDVKSRGFDIKMTDHDGALTLSSIAFPGGGAVLHLDGGSSAESLK